MNVNLKHELGEEIADHCGPFEDEVEEWAVEQYALTAPTRALTTRSVLANKETSWGVSAHPAVSYAMPRLA
jgi:hypothetical protein